MPKQIQIKPAPVKRESEKSDAPTVNRKIARLWFRNEE